MAPRQRDVRGTNVGDGTSEGGAQVLAQPRPTSDDVLRARDARAAMRRRAAATHAARRRRAASPSRPLTSAASASKVRAAATRVR